MNEEEEQRVTQEEADDLRKEADEGWERFCDYVDLVREVVADVARGIVEVPEILATIDRLSGPHDPETLPLAVTA